MPMNLPDVVRLHMAAQVHKFRGINYGESEDEYRSALAAHVHLIDRIKSYEIEFKIGGPMDR